MFQLSVIAFTEMEIGKDGAKGVKTKHGLCQKMKKKKNSVDGGIIVESWSISAKTMKIIENPRGALVAQWAVK